MPVCFAHKKKTWTAESHNQVAKAQLDMTFLMLPAVKHQMKWPYIFILTFLVT